jgi:DNA-binding NarL/FixJ family response regulator
VTIAAAPPATEPIRVLLVDREETFRTDMRGALERDGLSVAASVDSPDGAVAALGDGPVDVVLVDASAAGDSLAAVLRAAAGSAVVALSPSNEPDAVIGALAAGADGYLLKDDATPDVAGAVLRAAAFGRPLVSPRTARMVTARLQELERASREPRELTGRELEVLRLMSDGCTNGEIAARLGVSPSEIDRNVASIRAQLGVAEPRRQQRRFSRRP